MIFFKYYIFNILFLSINELYQHIEKKKQYVNTLVYDKC
jgi:hypothetical protein